MSNIATIDHIKALRNDTDAPYKDCVEALNQNENDIDAAAKWLKEKGKNETRLAPANAGTIGISGDNTIGHSVVIVKCETDFVAINPEFIALVDKLAHDYNQGNNHAEELLRENVWTFKENIEIGELTRLPPVESLKLAYYLHHNRNRASVVWYSGDNEEAAKKIAMQVCAMRPTYVGRDKADQTFIDELHTKEMGLALASGKPEAIAQRIADGKVNNALKDIVLLEQPMFDNNKQTVGQYAKENGIEVSDFVNFVV